ncbi:MAG: type II toxin-antitoxin system HicA family toxin [Candidatus Nomurabacteria bacterium]|nr:type II toxin-antitoxin system HicA family toxin [Candidatus Nomurabacteria bacterium]
MPKLPSVKGKKLIKILEKVGWYLDHTQGSHYILRNENGKKLTVAVHGNSEIPKGTLLGTLNDADISKDEFILLLKR